MPAVAFESTHSKSRIRPKYCAPSAVCEDIPAPYYGPFHGDHTQLDLSVDLDASKHFCSLNSVVCPRVRRHQDFERVWQANYTTA